MIRELKSHWKKSKCDLGPEAEREECLKLSGPALLVIKSSQSRLTCLSPVNFTPGRDRRCWGELTTFTFLYHPSFLQGSHFKATLLNSRPCKVCIICITSLNALSQLPCEVGVIINFIFKTRKQGLEGRAPSPKVAQVKGQNRDTMPNLLCSEAYDFNLHTVWPPTHCFLILN